MIPCKMPDEAPPSLSATIELLQQAYENTKEMTETDNDKDRRALYLELAKAINDLTARAKAIEDKTT